MKNREKAVLYMILSTLSFALMAVCVKFIPEIPLFEKMFFRNLVSLFIAYTIIRKGGDKVNILKSKNLKYLIIRSTLGVMGVAFNFYAITHLYLADQTILQRTSPFFVTLFAFLFLKEHLSKIQIPVLLSVFAGAIMVIKPEFNMDILPALAALLGAICAGGAYTMIRFLKDREKPAVIVFFFSIFSVVVTFIPMVMNFYIPNLEQLLYLLGIGVFAGAGQITLTSAYKYAKASEVSVYNYTGIVFGVILGYIFWSEIPDGQVITGGIIIVVSALVMYFYNKRKTLTS